MRNNLPITGQEHRFGQDECLVSVTDPKGRITYCNGAFVEVSGFAREELMGQPHNLVRHPDMPEEAFRDMWATLQSGLPWTGIVKNRRRNGDHYWVRANATPMVDAGTTVGYLSVRTCPSREEVEAAGRVYECMRTEAASGQRRLGLQGGAVVRVDWLGRLAQRLQAPLALRVFGLQLASGAVALATLPLGVATAAVAALATAGAGWWVQRAWLLAPLAGARGHALRLAAGDLTSGAGSADPGAGRELDRALAQLAVNLRTVVRDTRGQMSSVGIAAQEIAAASQALSERTESQASSLQQTAASMEQIQGTVAQTADTAAQGATLAAETAQLARRSHESVASVREAMASITESSRRIGEISQLIEAVAFQTNILALNAAVEAARAGDSGRGFAVVAGEVRGLAQRTTQAAREIKQLIAESATRVALGAERSDDAHARMSEVLAASARMDTLIAEIAGAATEQKGAMTQVNQAVAHLDDLTQQNAAMVEEMAGAAASLAGQVGEVSQSMRLFRLRAGDRTVAEEDAVGLRRAAMA
jgi:aerotaxis receptor